jgi:hypothetical protein
VLVINAAEKVLDDIGDRVSAIKFPHTVEEMKVSLLNRPS